MSKKQRLEIETLMKEKEDLHKSEEACKQKLNEIEEQTTELKNMLERLTAENTELKNKLHTEEPYEKMFDERKDLIEKDYINTNKIKELENEKNILNETISSINAEKETIMKEKGLAVIAFENEKEKIKELISERQELEIRIDEHEKRKGVLEDEILKLKIEITKLNQAREDIHKAFIDQKQDKEMQNKAFIEDMRKEIHDSKNKVERLLLESEALKSENEALFRANESKKEEINDIQKEVTNIKNELQIEKMRYKKLKDEWEQEKNRTEFVMVSKSGNRMQKPGIKPFKEENDSEEEHIVNIVEAANAEKEALIEKERNLRRRVNQLQIDKEELFKSGTNLFTENKSLKEKYDSVVSERTTLLQVEAALKRKVRSQDEEIKDLKKTIDEMYYQNIAIKSNEDSENKRSAYVVVMGNEMIKQLEREKSALHRRVKFLEKENNEIESRVIELERQSRELVTYSNRYDKHSAKPEGRSRNIEYDSIREKQRSQESSREHKRNKFETLEKLKDFRSNSGEREPYHEYKENSPHSVKTRSPDYYQSNGSTFAPTFAPTFAQSSSRHSRFAPANNQQLQSQGSRLSFPHIKSRMRQSPRPRTLSPKENETRSVHITVRR